jgi:hypothetical protein
MNRLTFAVIAALPRRLYAGKRAINVDHESIAAYLVVRFEGIQRAVASEQFDVPMMSNQHHRENGDGLNS